MALVLNGSGITSANIADGTIVNADINSSAAIDGSKLTGISDNTPAFLAYTETEVVNGSTWDLVIFGNELFDSDSDYDTSTGKFTPSEAGKYQISCQIEFSQIDSDTNAQIAIRKNGSEIAKNFYYPHNPGGTGGANISAMPFSLVVDANGTTDYFQIYVYQTSGARNITAASISTYSSHFSGYKLAGV